MMLVVIGGFVGMAAVYIPVQMAECGAHPSNLCGLGAGLLAPIGAIVGGTIGGMIAARLNKRRLGRSNRTS